MPRSPKSRSPRWTMTSLFSSGFSSSRRTAITTQREDSVNKENPTTAKDVGTPASEEAATPPQVEAGPWILLHDRDGRRFLWNKSTGQWTYDGIAIYPPPAPAIDAMGYSDYGLRQQQQQQQQQHEQQRQHTCSYAQPHVGYCAAPGHHAAAYHYPWQPSPPRMIPAAPGAAPIFF